jgi:hypothetical protein
MSMSGNGAEIRPDDVEHLARLLDLQPRPNHKELIASMLTAIRGGVCRKAADLAQDAPLSIFFDARP